MSEEDERVRKALEVLAMVGGELERLRFVLDPVARRRIIVPCAKALRQVADSLDQHGWLTE